MTNKPKLVHSSDPEAAIDDAVALQSGGPGGTSGGMDAVWKKLEEHDHALSRIQADTSGLKTSVSHLPSRIDFYVGGIVFIVAIVGVMIALGSFMSGTMSTALSAIQTVIAERPPVAASQPIVIAIPQQHVRPIAPAK
jgi:hypothetical protein